MTSGASVLITTVTSWFLFFRKFKDGADLEVAVLTAVVVQTVTVAKVRAPRVEVIALGRRPSYGAVCEFCPTGSAESRVYGALIIFD